MFPFFLILWCRDDRCRLCRYDFRMLFFFDRCLTMIFWRFCLDLLRGRVPKRKRGYLVERIVTLVRLVLVVLKIG